MMTWSQKTTDLTFIDVAVQFGAQVRPRNAHTSPQLHRHGKGSPDVHSSLQVEFSLKGWMLSMEIYHLHICVHTQWASF